MSNKNTHHEADDIAIRVSNLSKCYQIYNAPRDRLKQFVLPRLQRIAGKSPKQYFREFWALKDVSFEVKKGETVGIIGRNGSGKSTLLQMICGTLSPTSGSVETRGRIAALLELGSGFNPEFTGRDNVYMNAAVLGLSREEVDACFDHIAAFADIGEFINQPVKTYSSGMVVRLAFAVQSQIEPDILIVDEALSVGDAKFQAKCFEQLRKLKENGTSILLVTHSSEQIVTHCSNAILLNNGVQLESGAPSQIINRYMDLLFGKEKKTPESPPAIPNKAPASPAVKTEFPLSNSEDVFFSRPGYNPYEYRWGNGAATILDFYLAADDDLYPSSVATGQTMRLGISIKFNSDLVRPIFGLVIKTKEGITVNGANSETLECTDFQSLLRAGAIMHTKASFKCRLAPGDYFISIGLATRQGEEYTPHDRRYDAIHLVVRPHAQFIGITDLDLKLSIADASKC